MSMYEGLLPHILPDPGDVTPPLCSLCGLRRVVNPCEAACASCLAALAAWGEELGLRLAASMAPQTKAAAVVATVEPAKVRKPRQARRTARASKKRGGVPSEPSA